MNERDKLILIAEDDAVLRLIIVKQLSKLGYIGHTVENGAEAVVMAAKIPYKLILMDIQMPKMDGIEATKAIRQAEQERSGKRVPIVALTATTDRETCLEAGMDDFLSKPITTEQLQSAFDKWAVQSLPS
jgi:two-component system, sensor histidine kinase and response regulator